MGKGNRALRLACWDSGLRQYQIAEKAGIDPTSFNMIVAGRRPGTEAQRKAIAKVLRKPVEELFPEVTV